LVQTKIYRNEDVEEIVVAVPSGHQHARFLIKLVDQEIVLQEATVAALVRAFTNIVLHPWRRGVVLKKKLLSNGEKKHGFAKYQLIEVPDSEESAVETITMLLKSVE